MTLKVRSRSSHDVSLNPTTVSRPNGLVDMYFKPGSCSKPSPYPTPSRPISMGAVVTISASTRGSEAAEARNDWMTRAPPSTMIEWMPLSRSVRRTTGRGRFEETGGRSGSAWRQWRCQLFSFKERVRNGRMVSGSTRITVTPAAWSAS
jgi:hypothetical protein